jgi:hypothetical protein
MGFIGYSMGKVSKGKVLRMVGFSANCNNREVYLFNERFNRSYNICTRFASPSSYNSYTSILSIYAKIRHYMVREIVHLNLDELKRRVCTHDIRGKLLED